MTDNPAAQVARAVRAAAGLTTRPPSPTGDAVDVLAVLTRHRDTLADLAEPHDVSYDDAATDMLYCHTCEEPLDNLLLFDNRAGEDIVFPSPDLAERRHLIDVLLNYLRHGRTD